jgi:GDP-L-fucose synthase
MEKESKIFVAGHKGLVGSSIIRKLTNLGYENILTVSRSELDLTDQKNVADFFQQEKPEYVFDAAAKVGGIYANDTFSAEFIHENLNIQNNLIHNSYLCGAKKFLFMGSVCIYPKYAETPVTEESLMTGYLEPTNEAYAIAKIAGIKMCQAYYKQYGFKSVSIMPSNLYGPNDNYHPDNGHVIPGMIRKFVDNPESVTFWGDGSVYREFMYADDMADACIFLMNCNQTEKGDLINAGSGEDISIKELASMICNLMNYKGKINWDTTRPNGTPKRPLDFSKIKSLGWRPKFSLKEGLIETLKWYNTNNGYNRKFDR